MSGIVLRALKIYSRGAAGVADNMRLALLNAQLCVDTVERASQLRGCERHHRLPHLMRASMQVTISVPRSVYDALNSLRKSVTYR